MSKLNNILSRVVDYSIFALVAQTVTSLVTMYMDPVFSLIGLFCIPIFYIPVEALQLYMWQTTLGRALFGLRVCEAGRAKLSFKGALRAALTLFKKSPRISVTATLKKRGRVLGTILMLVLSLGLTMNNYILPKTLGFSLVALSDGWTRFVSKEGKFSVDMPSKPDFAMKEFPVPPAGITLALSDYTAKVEDNVAYSVNYVNLPRSWLLASSKKILSAALYLKYETQLGCDVLSKKMATHMGRLPAIDFVAKEQGRRIQGRLVLAGNKLFQVSKSTPMSAKPETKKTSDDGKKSPDENFIDSFNPLIR